MICEMSDKLRANLKEVKTKILVNKMKGVDSHPAQEQVTNRSLATIRLTMIFSPFFRHVANVMR